MRPGEEIGHGLGEVPERLLLHRLRPSRQPPELPPGLGQLARLLQIARRARVPGTSAPEPSGLSYDELRDLLVAVARRNEVIGFDLVEVNPMVDQPNQSTSFLGVQLVVELLARAVEHPGYRRRHPRTTEEPGTA
jgi:hypothetical protein